MLSNSIATRHLGLNINEDEIKFKFGLSDSWTTFQMLSTYMASGYHYCTEHFHNHRKLYLTVLIIKDIFCHQSTKNNVCFAYFWQPWTRKKITSTATKGKTYTGKRSSDEGKQSKKISHLEKKNSDKVATVTVNSS